MASLAACTATQTKTFDELIRGAEQDDLDKGLLSEEQVASVSLGGGAARQPRPLQPFPLHCLLLTPDWQALFVYKQGLGRAGTRGLHDGHDAHGPRIMACCAWRAARLTRPVAQLWAAGKRLGVPLTTAELSQLFSACDLNQDGYLDLPGLAAPRLLPCLVAH